jgi:hypothetical protein
MPQIDTWLILGRSESFLPLIKAYNNSVFSFTFSVHITCKHRKCIKLLQYTFQNQLSVKAHKKLCIASTKVEEYRKDVQVIFKS